MNKKIYVKSSRGNNFIRRFLPELFISRLYSKSKNKQYKRIFDYISNNYKISKKDIFETLKNNLIFSNYGANIVITSNDNIRLNKDIRLSAILSLIDYGNLEVKGTNLINDIIDWLNNKIDHVYILYLATQKKKEKSERS